MEPVAVDNPITIGAPKFEKDTEIYLFDLTRDGKLIDYDSALTYTLSLNEPSQLILIPNTNELKFFHSLYTEIRDLFVKHHVEWFENVFTASDVDSLFKSFLIPNISENRIDLKIEILPELFEELKSLGGNGKIISGVPTFSFRQLSLNYIDEKMECVVLISKFNSDNSERVLEPHSSIGDQGSFESNDWAKINHDEDINNSDINNTTEVVYVDEECGDSGDVADDNTTMYELDGTSPENYLEEVKLEPTDTIDLKVDNDDYLIIYNYLVGIADSKFHNEIKSILQEKGVNLNDVVLEDILYDSDNDNTYSDDETFDEGINKYI